MNSTAENLKENALKILKKYFGYDHFRTMQFEVIEKVVQKKDVVLIMPTGGGKSVCFQIPALLFEGLTVVISPLIALMKDQVQGLRANGIAAAFLNSSLSRDEENDIVQDIVNKKVKLIYVSPEKLMTQDFYSLIKELNISLFAIDEAHCISQWGHDFRPEYTKLKILKEFFPHVPIIALTATADKLTREDIADNLNLVEPEKFIASFDRPNLKLEVRQGLKKFEQIIRFIDQRNGESGIIYCLSRKSTEDLAGKLKKSGLKVTFYHAGMASDARSKAQDKFLKGKVDIICATIAFGMGIDKSNVRWVIHYNMPKNIESFYQEIGRAGRDGLAADTLLFYSFQDVIIYRKFLEESGRKEIEEAKLNRMLEYCEGVSCRRRILLAYFGEHLENDCGNCDVCSNPPKRFDGTIIAQKALSALSRLQGNVGMNMLINVLRGSQAREIFENKYHEIKTYGAGSDISFQAWQQYILQLLNHGYIEIAYNKGNTLQLTEASQDVLYKKKQVKMVNFSEVEQKQEAKVVATLTVKEQLEMELFSLLNEKRKELAEKENLAPHLIFSDVSLREMVEKLPIDGADFKTIQGVSKEKLVKYGLEFSHAIGLFIEEKLSQKKNIVGSSPKLTYFYFSIQKLSVQQIIKKRGLGSLTVIGHLALMYENGKNIDIHKFITPEELETILSVINTCKTEEELTLKSLYFKLEEKIDYEKIKWALAHHARK